MYVPRHFEEHDVTVLHALIQSGPLGTWVTQADGALLVNHIPFLIDATRGQYGTLVGHVARANPVWRSFSRELPSVVVFQGPQTYIRPSWYASKQAHGKVVPTWNYAVVHAHGIPRAIEDRDWLLHNVTALSEHHEASHDLPWRLSDAPSDYIEGSLKAIVGIELPIDTLVGKWKTSQNRNMADRLGTIQGLTARGDDEALRMADLVRRHTTIETDDGNLAGEPPLS